MTKAGERLIAAAQEARQMAVSLCCNCCGKTIFLQPSREGCSASVSLVGSEGWRFDTEHGWRCPDHFQEP